MPVCDQLSRLESEIDDLCAVDPGVLADGDTIVFLHRQFERLDAALTRATARFDAEDGYVSTRALSAAAWMSSACRMPLATAQRRVRIGRGLREMPVTEAAWLAGDINSAHVAALDRARTPATAGAFGGAEEMLVDKAKDLPFRAFARTLHYWGQLADPEGIEKTAEDLAESRRVHLSQTFADTWRLDGLLDPIAGSILDNELRRLTDDLFHADWAEARERVGQDATLMDLCRSAQQRRADALVEMARRSAAMPEGSRMPEPLFTVVVGYETFSGRICELANGTVVSPGSLVKWLDHAWIERVVFESPSRVIDVGIRRRLFTGATRRAVQVRDGECFHPFCETPAERCQVDHVEPYGEGGLTTEANGRAACAAHNRQRHPRHRRT